MLCVLTTQRESFPREPLREIASELFELRSQPARQLRPQRFRRGGMCLARLLVAFLLKFFERSRRFIGDFGASRGKLLFPLLEGEAVLGGNGLRSSFLRSGLNLLPGVGDEPGYLARQLKRRIRRARGRRKDAQIVICVRRCVCG